MSALTTEEVKRGNVILMASLRRHMDDPARYDAYLNAFREFPIDRYVYAPNRYVEIKAFRGVSGDQEGGDGSGGDAVNLRVDALSAGPNGKSYFHVPEHAENYESTRVLKIREPDAGYFSLPQVLCFELVLQFSDANQAYSWLNGTTAIPGLPNGPRLRDLYQHIQVVALSVPNGHTT